MSKEQEALDNLANFAYHGGEKGDNVRVLQDLINSKKPIKPTMLPYNGFDGEVASYRGCPNCLAPIYSTISTREYKPNFCQHCGCEFDWSKDE